MLKGKTAIVTGGSRGIGRAIARRLASMGADIAVIYAGNAEAAVNVCLQIRENTVPLYSNMTAGLYAGNAAELLSGQICSPVLWEKIIRNMIKGGVDTFIEIGPGKTLCNMIRRISSDVTAVSVTDYLSEVEAC